MIQIEDEILARLAAAEGDITDDKDLIEGLEAAKRTARHRGQAHGGPQDAESINNTSEKFRLVARRGSQLFFIMNDLVKIHTYYIYSLNAFVVVFLNGIDQVQRESKEAEEEAKPKKKKGFGLKAFKKIAKKVIGGLERFPWNRDILMNASHSDTLDSDFLDKLMSIGKKKSPRGGEGSEGTFKADPRATRPETTVEKYVDYAARCVKLIDTCTSVCFNYVRRGLFERDKLTIVSLFVLTLQIAGDKLGGAYLGIMLGGREAEGEPAPEDCGDKVPMFGGLLKHIEENASAWESWYNHKSPETETPPLPEGCPAPNLFEMVLLLCTMRSDRVTMGVTNYIASNYGGGYVHQPPFDMKKAYQESTASTPIFFVLFPGVDPTLWGQEAPAEAMLEKMAHDGGWVMLQNLHLMQSWLPVLERKLEVCSSTRQDFGATRASAVRCRSSSGCLFGLCFFHSVMLGRKRFGQQGWSRKYGFNMGDLTICADVLQTYLDDNGRPYDLIDINEKAAPLLKGKEAPYIVVVLQEVGRMNGLCAEMGRTLEELRKGLLGQLNMSELMEELMSALLIKQMSAETHVSAFNEPDEITERLTEGAYIHGMFCEGACWGEVENEAFDDTVDSTQLAGILRDSRPRALPHMPIMRIKAVQVQPTWGPAVGYLRPEPTIATAPCT
ncbi:hypothetical protein JL720_11304 [Aureococcus anophagefferens]|nr:hypothetical protein JL720_11304 [Aureococcus anophagefferens]